MTPRRRWAVAAAVAIAAAGTVPMLTDAGPLGTARGALVEWTASVAARVLPAVGVPVRRDGPALVSPDGRRARVVRDCDALAPLALLLAGLVVAPGGRARRVVVAVGGGLAVLALNQVRIAHLVTLVGRDPRGFQRAHEFIWPAVLCGTVLGAIAFASTPRRCRR
ncbi:MAG: archaeosortase/exosortase family protein [Planctomycetia bacterium]|nr:archaeosortase/exosortase family protein [Planctomycetia bacterium]